MKTIVEPRPKRVRYLTVFILLGVGLVAIIILATGFGAANITTSDLLKMALDKLPFIHFPATWRPADETILFQIRLPRVIAGMLVGGALSAAGVLLQGLLRNPMADPYIIGTSGGAALGATIAMILPVNFSLLGFGLVPLFAFFGAWATVLLVYGIARRSSGKAPIVNILLAGFVVSSIFTAAIAFLMSISDRLSLNLHSFYSFIFGHISVTSWSQLAIIGPLVVAGIIGAFVVTVSLNAFSLGEEGAAYLGIEVERAKIFILCLASLLTAAAVSISGLIGFVGLVVPHTVRLIIGPEHKLLLPASVLAGSIFLVMADLLARTVISPVEIPVGVITAIVGGPFFLYILRRGNREYAF